MPKAGYSNKPTLSRVQRTGVSAAVIRNRILTSGEITPIEVMLGNMRWHWQRAVKIEATGGADIVEALLEENPEASQNKRARVVINAIKEARREAEESARAAAPFIHPRLNTVEVEAEVEHRVHAIVSEIPLTVQEWTELYGNKDEAKSEQTAH